MRKLVIILGMHRSGTSVVTQICQHMGAYLGEENELMAATNDNQDGYFENTEISNINDDILHACEREWYSLRTVELEKDRLPVIHAKDELKNKIKRLFEKNNVVAVKDPRIAVLLPIWEEVLKELGVITEYIWVLRNPLEVCESLRRRNGFCRKHSLLLWIHYNLSIVKFLENKDYLLINYNNIRSDFKALKPLSDFFCVEYDDDLYEKVETIIKQSFVHSRYSEREICSIKDELVSELYFMITRNKIKKEDIQLLEEKYIRETDKIKSRYIDCEIFEDIGYLNKKEIVIYGAGNYGKISAEMLQDLGVQRFVFCDKDISKHGDYIMGGKVVSINEIDQKEDILAVVAIADKEIRKEIEQTLMTIKGIEFLSFFSLKKVWKYLLEDYTTMESKAEKLSLWYKELEWRSRKIRNVCKYPVLVYQNGKVGSSTVSDSLRNAGVDNEHIHRFFYKRDIVGELILGKEKLEFIENSNYFGLHSPEFVKCIKGEMKCKKFITMVREPIAVDLSTVFHWIGTGTADFYFADQLKKGRSFLQAVTELMVKLQNRLFYWFEEELNELCGINIWEYPFDKQKGYSVISKDEMEILIIKVEKLFQMTEVIRDFVDSSKFQIQNTNRGSEKEYSNLYKEVKRKLRLPKEYLDLYYNDNFYMNYFYTKKEQREFLNKWTKCI